MLYFKNDYSDGGHPDVLQALLDTSHSLEAGYGEDTHSEKARQLIKAACKAPNALVRFVSGGTQSNLIIISSILKSYETVISASSGHINKHEAGAIEATGHKVDTVDTPEGKLTPDLVQVALDRFEDCHTVMPRLVYISNTTELGTVYSKVELTELSEFCKSKGLYLFMDGARLASGLAASDLTLEDIAALTDVFYIGGTKNGALFGEAIVITNPDPQEHFDFHIKQRGALLAKGRALGVQFKTLFEGNLYLELGNHANQMAKMLADGITAKGYDFESRPQSNQIFPILPNNLIEKLEQNVAFYVWTPNKERSSIRLVTSWKTTEEEVQNFLDLL